MSNIYLIAGIGADTRIYNNIEFPESNDIIPIDWIEPHKTDTLESYAQKLIYQYDIKPNSIVIGNSLGGMLAIEIAKKINIKKVILISSIKTINEAPWYYTVFKRLPVYKIIPGNVFTSLGLLIKPVFGKMKAEDLWLFKDMLKNTSPKFLKWAMGAALNWDNKIILPNVFHIHGDKDRAFPLGKINDATILKGGTHIMIFDKAKQINKWLKPILKK
jgi:pimeloyl-ACP methyl ester carboxylesterase